jgi:hypothetical protein
MNFSIEELAVLALIIEEGQTRKKRKWVRQAWMKRGAEVEFATVYKELVSSINISSFISTRFY